MLVRLNLRRFLNKIRSQSDQRGLRAILNVELLENVLDVLLHGLNIDLQLLGNALVGKPLRNGTQDFLLTGPERTSIMQRDCFCRRAADNLSNLSRRPALRPWPRGECWRAALRASLLWAQNPRHPSLRACAISLTSSAEEKIKTAMFGFSRLICSRALSPSEPDKRRSSNMTSGLQVSTNLTVCSDVSDWQTNSISVPCIRLITPARIAR